jgi:hypothetical protein
MIAAPIALALYLAALYSVDRRMWVSFTLAFCGSVMVVGMVSK